MLHGSFILAQGVDSSETRTHFGHSDPLIVAIITEMGIKLARKGIFEFFTWTKNNENIFLLIPSPLNTFLYIIYGT